MGLKWVGYLPGQTVLLVIAEVLEQPGWKVLALQAPPGAFAVGRQAVAVIAPGQSGLGHGLALRLWPVRHHATVLLHPL
jgi:hypothetical protein